MTRSGDEHYRAASGVLCQEVNGEMVLLDLSSEQYFGLNEVGAQAWDALVSGQTLAELRNTLVERFEVPPERLARDLQALVVQLLDARLLELVEPDEDGS